MLEFDGLRIENRENHSKQESVMLPAMNRRRFSASLAAIGSMALLSQSQAESWQCWRAAPNAMDSSRRNCLESRVAEGTLESTAWR